jgi:TRAP-type C4-dicarboxylate transport system permease large subunit
MSCRSRLIFVVVIGAMSGGFATPTESAALGALATMALAIVYRVLTVGNLMRALRGTVMISTLILFIILGAVTFAQILSFSGATQGIVSAVLDRGLSHYGHPCRNDGATYFSVEYSSIRSV